MYYKTFFKINQTSDTLFTIDALYQGTITQPNNVNIPYPEKQTIRLETKPNLNAPPLVLELLNATLSIEVDKTYTVYRIPKTKGGFRTISAPSESLKDKQKSVYDILVKLGAHPHNAVYSYTPFRTCKDAIARHQDANTQWYYKFDIKDFFPSCTPDVLTNVLQHVYPFCSLPDDTLQKIIELAVYNNSLPQGSPLSPLLSNMVLTAFDFITYYSVKHFNGVYTRYADDILISFPEKRSLTFVQRIVQNHLQEISQSFKLNFEKSRCGSRNGSNWNLGLMLNKNNEITLGHKKKMELKAKINNFIFDFTNQRYWSIIDTQVLQGEINYFKNIEPEYATFVIQRLERKYNTPVSLSQMFRQIISQQ